MKKKKHMEYRKAVRDFKRLVWPYTDSPVEKAWLGYISHLFSFDHISAKQYHSWCKINPMWKREVAPEIGPLRKQLTITVSGGLASGKTTIAFEITKMLLGMGFKVKYEDPDYSVEGGLPQNQELKLKMLKTGGLIATVKTEQDPRR